MPMGQVCTLGTIHTPGGRAAAFRFAAMSIVVLPLLPEDWQESFAERVADGKAILKSVDGELDGLAKLARSFPSLISMKHAAKRLSQFKFEVDLDRLLDLDMMTTAFVVSYARLQQGGVGSGFSRKSLPDHLRAAHDQIIEFRNKRFAHTDEHESVSSMLRIDMHEENFHPQMQLSLGFYIGGANEWHELAAFIDEMFYDRLDKILKHLSSKTGRTWVMPSGPELGYGSEG